MFQDLHKLVTDASVDHVEFMEDERNKAMVSSAEIGRKLDTESVGFSEWNNRITTELRTTKHQIDKFLVEDLRHDVPTGLLNKKNYIQIHKTKERNKINSVSFLYFLFIFLHLCIFYLFTVMLSFFRNNACSKRIPFSSNISSYFSS